MPAIVAKARAESARPKLRSFVIVAGMFPVLLIVSLFASWQAIDLVNATRAYAVGEGRYSKAQKMAVLDLYRYANSEDRKDFDLFLQDIDVPLGDRAARIALSGSAPNIADARSALLRGQNHPRDIDGLVTLFLRFYWWKPFAAAVEDWRTADEQVQALIAEGRKLHARIAKGTLNAGARRAALRRIEALDAAITTRENTFSSHIGEASRLATTLVVWGLGISTVLLWAIGISFAVRLLRRQLALDSQLASSESRFRDYAEVASDWFGKSMRRAPSPMSRTAFSALRTARSKASWAPAASISSARDPTTRQGATNAWLPSPSGARFAASACALRSPGRTGPITRYRASRPSRPKARSGAIAASAPTSPRR